MIVASQIPFHLDLELRTYMGRLIFPILEARYAAEIAGADRRSVPPALMALYAGGSGGFLFSVGID